MNVILSTLMVILCISGVTYNSTSALQAPRLDENYTIHVKLMDYAYHLTRFVGHGAKR